MSEFPPVVYIDLKQSKFRKRMRRPQTWFWVAKSGGNQKKLGWSGDFYTNRADCVSAIYLLLGNGTNVYLRPPNESEVLLRGPAEAV